MDRKGWMMLSLCVALSGPAVVADESASEASADEASAGVDEGDGNGLNLLRPRESPAVEPQRGPTVEGVGAGGPRVDVDPSVVGLPPGETVPRARREGAFVVNQPGRVLRPEAGSQWIFQPAAEGDEANELPPMLVMPSARLEMIETYMQEQGGEPWFEVSGRVHAYRGVNYLLLTQARPQVDAGAEAAAEDEAEPADEEQSAATDADEDEDPMLTALLEQRQAVPTASRERGGEGPGDRADVVAGSAPGGAGVAASAEGSGESLRDEGSMIVQRRGRVTRSRDGGHVLFVFEADDRASPETPMILQACRLLERMETIVQQRGEQVTFVVSGQVQRYHGANYLLPTMMQVVPDRGNLGR